MNETHHLRGIWLPLLAIWGMIILSCTDDVYDPTKKRDIAPAENPFGADFVAPSGFDWSMLTTVSLQVEVQDIYNGSYEYLIEVFATHPNSNPAPAPIAAGYANSDHLFSTTLSLPKGLDRIFIRKTSPRQAKEFYEFPVTSHMECKLYRQSSETRSTASSPAPSLKHRDAGGAPETPADAQEWDIEKDGTAKWTAGNYILISSENSSSSNVVAGNGANLYVNSPVTLAGLTIQGGCSLTILPGGSLTLSGTLNANNPSNVNNYGTINVGHTDINTGSVLLNQGIITVSGKMYLCSCTLDNYGTIEANSKVAGNWDGSYSESIQTNSSTDAVINNYVGATILATAIKNGFTLNNEGHIEVTDMSGGAPIVINNLSSGTIQMDFMSGNSLQVYNAGTLKTNNVNATSYTSFTNECTFIITGKLKLANDVTLKNGTLTGNKSAEGWLPIQEIELGNGTNLTMESSYILADHIICGYNVIMKGLSGSAPSMIQTGDIQYEWTTELSGSLYLDCNEEKNLERYRKDESVVTSTPMGSARAYIETCSGIMYNRQEKPDKPDSGNEGGESGGNDPDSGNESGGNTPGEGGNPPGPGEGGGEGWPGGYEPDPEPSNPPLPEEISPVSSCTYAFEDQWPIYGDYDLNDIVFSIDEIKLKYGKSGWLKEVKINGDLKAVGASNILGIGIRFLGLNSSYTFDDFQCNWTTGYTSWEEGNDYPTLILTEDAFAQMAGSRKNRAFINTVIDGYHREYKGYDIKIKFPNEDVPPAAFDLSKLDVFIFCRTKAYSPYRREIHLPGYHPTNWADQSYEGTGNDNGYRSYTSHEGLPWGLCVPTTNWRWPLECFNIINESVYPQFESWVLSGSSMNSTWYYDYDSSKVY